MKYVVAAFLLLMGALMVLKTDLVWKYAESWKYKGTGDAQAWYLWLIRAGGAVLIAGAICAFFVD